MAQIDAAPLSGIQPIVSDLGKILVVVGVVIAVLGLTVMIFGRSLPLGRLPGDISYRRGNFSFYFPVVTSIVLSIVLMLILWLIGRFR